MDKFYTKKNIADFCIQQIKQELPSIRHFVEPSAGSGNFMFEETIFAGDILPECENVILNNWLLERPFFSTPYCLYGNPPFGKRNKLSKSFIMTGVNDSLCKSIAFILPQVFKKHTLQKVFPITWGLQKEIDLPNDSFTFNGENYSLSCILQIWVRKNFTDYKGIDRRAIERFCFSNQDFEIVKNSGDLFVMGASPKTVKFPQEVTPNNRGYWLKSKIDIIELKSKIEKVPWDGNTCAAGGVFWLTKTEFINKYEFFHGMGVK